MPASTPPRDELTTAQVRKVASLARLSPTDAQVERYRVELTAVLGYVDRLRELDISDVEPLANPVQDGNRLREDVPFPGLPTAALMAIAPSPAPPFIAVPRILGDTSAA